MNIKEKMQTLSPLQKQGLIIGSVILVILLGIWLFSKPDAKLQTAGEQITLLTDSVRSFYQKKPNAWGLNTYSAIQNKIVPQSMLNGRQVKNSLNKDVLLGADVLGNTVMPGSRTFAIVYKNLSKEECIGLATYSFDEKTMIAIDAINIINDKTYSFSWGSDEGLPIKAEAAEKACQQVNDILWSIYL